jgi:hypothetical protein
MTKMNGIYITNPNKFKLIVPFMIHLLRLCLSTMTALNVSILNSSLTKSTSSNLISLKEEENQKLFKNSFKTKGTKRQEKEVKV